MRSTPLGDAEKALQRMERRQMLPGEVVALLSTARHFAVIVRDYHTAVERSSMPSPATTASPSQRRNLDRNVANRSEDPSQSACTIDSNNVVPRLIAQLFEAVHLDITERITSVLGDLRLYHAYEAARVQHEQQWRMRRRGDFRTWLRGRDAVSPASTPTSSTPTSSTPTSSTPPLRSSRTESPSDSIVDALTIEVEASRFPEIGVARERVQFVLDELDAELVKARKELGKPELTYRAPLRMATGATEEFLIEIDANDPVVQQQQAAGFARRRGRASASRPHPPSAVLRVPSDWVLVSQTSRLRRFRPPRVQALVDKVHGKLTLERTLLEIEYHRVWQKWLQDTINQLRDGLQALLACMAHIDVLHALVRI